MWNSQTKLLTISQCLQLAKFSKFRSLHVVNKHNEWNYIFLLNVDNSIKKLTIYSKSFEVTLSHFYKQTIVQRLLAGLPYVIYTLILQLTSLLAELGLDIQEAHAFSTIDGYSLDVFVVTGWHLGVQSCSGHRCNWLFAFWVLY